MEVEKPNESRIGVRVEVRVRVRVRLFMSLPHV